MRTLGLRLGKEELNLLFNEYDKDGNGAIDSAEFTDLVKNSMKEQGQLPHMNDSESAKIKFNSAQSFRCVRTYTHTHMHTHAHTCTHTHARMHIPKQEKLFEAHQLKLLR